MKQYEILWVPVDKESSKQSTRIKTECGTLDAIENSIVLTVKEAKELWNAAQDRANALQLGDPGDTKIFEAYMQSKGVNIEC